MRVFCPSDDVQTKWIVEEMTKIEGPCYIRTARLATPIIYDEKRKDLIIKNQYNLEKEKM